MIGRLVVALAVAGLTALAVTGRADDDPIRLVVAAHTFFGLVALVVLVLSRRRLLAALDRIRDARPVLATGLVEAPPTDVARLIAEVRGLGFELAGVTDTDLGGGPIRTWVLVEPTGETWVEVGKGLAPMAIFLSETPAGRQVETAYPTGEVIDEPALLAAPAGPTPEQALATHRARLTAEIQRAAAEPAALEPDEPEPDVPSGGWRVTTTEEYVAWETRQRARTGGMRIAAHLRSAVEPGIRDWTISVLIDAACIAALALVP